MYSCIASIFIIQWLMCNSFSVCVSPLHLSSMIASSQTLISSVWGGKELCRTTGFFSEEIPETCPREDRAPCLLPAAEHH